MNTHTPVTKLAALLVVSTALIAAPRCLGYDQATVGTYGSSAVEKSATVAPNDLASFVTAVSAAYGTNFGGVFNLPSTISSGTTLFRGNYGASQAKRLIVTSSNPMQGVGASGSFIPVTTPYGASTTADLTTYNLAIGPVVDATSGVALPEAVVRIGFTILSRNAGGYPLDVTATVYFSDGTTQSATANIGGTKGTDDTFFGFTAPSGLSITNLAFASFTTGTTTPVSTRIAFDDLGFVTGVTIPPPQVLNVSPFSYAIVKASDGIQFQALSYQVGIDAAGIHLVLNSNDVSSQLVISGDPTNRLVTYSGLAANQAYDMRIIVSNAVGSVTHTNRFYTADALFTLFDSGGFADTALYPVGPLTAVSSNGWSWTPPADAASIVDTLDAAFGPALQLMQMGNNQVTYLELPPVASGTVRIAFDVRVSTPFARTLDVSLDNTSGQQGCFISCGTVTNESGVNAGLLAYYGGGAWTGLTNLDTAWHHIELTNYLSGVCADTYDLTLDGVMVGHLLPWRNAAFLSPMSRLRLGTISGATTEYAQVDNLIVQAGPEASGVLPRPQILNVSPANYAMIRPTAGFQFEAFSYAPIEPAGISLALNSNDVSAQLVLSGDSTNRSVSYTGLAANRSYDAQIVVSNAAGIVSYTTRFYTADPTFALYDSGGFSDPALYPIGLLTALSTNDWAWLPPADAAQIVDSGDAAYGPALQVTQMGVDETALLYFQPVCDGIIRVSFDARISNPYVRTIDLSLYTSSGSAQTWFLGWGVVTNQYGTNSGQVAYYNGSSWVGLAEVGTGWHHYEWVNYLSGPNIGKSDLALDGAVVGRLFPWRQAISPLTPLGRLRLGAIRGGVTEYGQVDNLQVTAALVPLAPDPVSILAPTRAAGRFTFRFQSQLGVVHTGQWTDSLGGAWNDLATCLGDGSIKTIVDSNASATRYYRVRSQ